MNAQYVVMPTFSAVRLGGLQGLATALPKDSFRTEGGPEATTVLYRDPERPVQTILFTGSTSEEVLRDLTSAVRIARGGAPDLSQSTLEYAVLRGVLKSLDPHSSFLDPESYREMQAEASGSFGGLGIELTVRDDQLTVVAPIEGAPAYRAGIRPGDRVIKIDGLPTKGMTLADAVKKMRGPKGTRVTITIQRQGAKEPQDVPVEREIIQVQSVKTSEIEPGLGYIRIRQFQERTAQDMEAGLDKLAKTGRLVGLVLDLRNNPGGLLSSAVEVSEKFLGDGKLVVYTEGRMKSTNMRFVAHARQPNTKVPIVVLVNQGSVQTIIPLSDGSGLRLTTAMYFTPKGRTIHDQGITPDVVVEVPRGDPENPGKPTLSEAEQHRQDVQLQRGLERLKVLAGHPAPRAR